jgi:hypothetical protein
MTRLFVPVLLCSLVGLTTPAMAHAPIMGIGGFLGGVLHALLVPEHGLSVVALGLVLGRQHEPVRRSGELIFITALVGGLIATALAVGETVAGDVLIGVTGVLGLLMAAAWMPPALGCALAAVAGVTLALDSPPQVTSVDEAVRMLVGSGVGAGLGLGLVAEGSVFLRGRAPSLAIRVLGSWVAAIAIMVLALRIVTRIAIG